jgi:uncharacterized protein
VGGCDDRGAARSDGGVRRVVLIAAILAAGPAAADCEPAQLRIETEGAPASFAVEIADTPEARARGLMFRTDLARDAGMLFLFDRIAPVTFWMKDTPLSLDMIFIGPDGRVCGMIERATPHSLDPRPSNCPTLAVLEVHGGVADDLGVTLGARVSHSAFGEDAAWPCSVAQPPEPG